MKNAKFLPLLLVLGAVIALTANCPGDGVAKPVKVSILDVAGNLQLTKTAIEAFKTAHPELVSEVEYLTSPAPELTARIKAQQAADNVDTSLVLTGFDGVAAGVEQGVWQKIMPDQASYFPNLEHRCCLPGSR